MDKRGRNRTRVRLVAACASLAVSAIVAAWLMAVLTPVMAWIGAVLASVALFSGLAVLSAALIVRAATRGGPSGEGATIDSLKARQS